MFGFLKKKDGAASKKPAAIAFVDYEHWYISCTKFFSVKPDIRGWRSEIAGRCDPREILFFADFSNPSLRAEIPRIREITSSIIETQNTGTRFKKDFTDFIMLDHIYQKALTFPDIDTFIIVSGDGHFSSAVSFLVNRCQKQVLVYGVRDAISTQLKNTATETIELPLEETGLRPYQTMLLENLKYLENSKKDRSRLYPTFWGTVENTAAHQNADRGKLADAMRQLIDRGYIVQSQIKIGNRDVKIISADWKSIERDGLI